MIKRILSRFPVYLLWALASVILWSYVFSFITDAKPARKLSLYISIDQIEEVELAARLEEKGLPDGIRMIKVRPFSYAMFSDQDLLSADLYIVRASEAESWRDSFRPLPDGMDGDLELGNGAQGIRVYDAETGVGVFDDLIDYSASGAAEDCYLFFGAQSQHTESCDGAALWLAGRFLEGSH